MSEFAELSTAARQRQEAAVLMKDFSMEVTAPTAGELDQLREILPSGTKVFVSAPPGHSHSRLASTASELRRRGFEPVPHVVARSFHSSRDLDEFLRRVVQEADAQRVLFLGGDLDTPAGPFSDAHSLLEVDLIQSHGIRTVYVAGYPDGHPKLTVHVLNDSLARKMRAAGARDLKVEIVSQFCFEPGKIRTWLEQMRASGVAVPIRIGVAGPTTVRGLMRFALRCGVRGSVKALLEGRSSAMFGEVSSDEIIAALADPAGSITPRNCAVHVFSFGGVTNTARWAASFGG